MSTNVQCLVEKRTLIYVGGFYVEIPVGVVFIHNCDETEKHIKLNSAS